MHQLFFLSNGSFTETILQSLLFILVRKNNGVVKKKKPQNKDLKNCLKAVAQIGIFNNQLLVEVDVLNKKNSMIRNEKNKIIDELKQELKQYEIRTE